MEKSVNMIEKIVVKENKILKLNNVLIREVSQNELIDINKITYMMDSYIKSKGNSTVGPMINYSAVEGDENGQAKFIIKLMVQLKNPIHNIEKPYELKNQIRVTNCLFARFTEKEENLQYAYSKLGLFAFENDMKLKGDSYTVFVNKNEEGIVADVFMELKEGVDELEAI
jgi:effector-binding domain-containing protein